MEVTTKKILVPLLLLRFINQTSSNFDALVKLISSADADSEFSDIIDTILGKNHCLSRLLQLKRILRLDDGEDVVLGLMTSFKIYQSIRPPFLVRKRLDWDEHVGILRREKRFKVMYRMSYKSFCKLVQLLRKSLTVDPNQSSRASKGEVPISPEIIMHVTLRYLAGGSVHDIRVLAGILHSSFYRFLRRGIDAINGCDALQLNWPHTMEELCDAAKGFHWSSSHGVINSCIGALDGWLCPI